MVVEAAALQELWSSLIDIYLHTFIAQKADIFISKVPRNFWLLEDEEHNGDNLENEFSKD